MGVKRRPPGAAATSDGIRRAPDPVADAGYFFGAGAVAGWTLIASACV